ncbi:bifunctional molybdenum cofactor biosynthesis protein MoaC/MoaB [Cytophaga hutchinsonii]|uniref:GTP cyclohydrolase subunit MoaC n=1 Tax=Cytophaga hutchinsonii (strain ATCC 33406 / DSM 1761 / CIP 103989 / NBRC 15051 / NCIMB 9469 / D465) TaxID=269798 RepID=A0A6N4SQK0_CYTH3|nr:bifunctional molybdenum cofactor biosynthesis protein MoaC/MoaB [Cytophaga hutchinsonii]ABG58602.1 GTP cyclohydrolase subunit MoaC [Cytophaga hutchinsonii ATCC 33406]SFX77987.1 cyclic pyranopterin monophosphate synthase subunit MoaC [Cytophaga hutchinsonii ATCC 33406]
MRDISGKQITLRTATGIGMVTCSASTVDHIKNDTLPKGNMFDVARAAAFLAAKNTSQLIPHCHPVGIDGMSVEFEILDPVKHQQELAIPLDGLYGVVIRSEIKSIGRTGIEIEALTGISIAALTVYDLLKNIDKHLSIGPIRLLEKTGGKSGQKYFNTPPKCAVLVCSDSTFEGKREDRSGKKIIEILNEHGITAAAYDIVPDERIHIQEKIRAWVNEDYAYIFTTGGTGLGPRDKTVEAVKELLERDADGIAEAMRVYGQMRTPLAMMSRAVAGAINETLIVTLPGSSNGVRECLEAIMPAVFHARKMMKGGGH